MKKNITIAIVIGSIIGAIFMAKMATKEVPVINKCADSISCHKIPSRFK